MDQDFMKLSERNIQEALYWMLHQRNNRYICPNFTPVGWWECDMFAITESGYWVEYEIKLCIPDFKRDHKKSREIWKPWKPGVQQPMESEKKHNLMALGSDRGPSRFYYILPADMIKPEDIPEFAGLIEAWPNPNRSISLMVKKKAPILHRTPAPQKVITQVHQSFYYRYWNLRHSCSTVFADRPAEDFSI